MFSCIRRREATVVTMVFMRQTIPRIPHIMPIYWSIHPSLFLVKPYFSGDYPRSRISRKFTREGRAVSYESLPEI